MEPAEGRCAGYSVGSVDLLFISLHPALCAGRSSQVNCINGLLVGFVRLEMGGEQDWVFSLQLLSCWATDCQELCSLTEGVADSVAPTTLSPHHFLDMVVASSCVNTCALSLRPFSGHRSMPRPCTGQARNAGQLISPGSCP